ncbi:MAG: hypothetical protein PVI30_23315 [Myxococcales bacterium]|jgi:hypothetical protein
MGRSPRLFELVYAGLAAACVWPLFYVDYPPIQDLPQHLAAIRVLHDYGDPQLGFARYFEIDLWRTQYLAYYVAADLLAYPLGVELANRVLIAASLMATPYAARALLTALGRDGRMSILLFPLAYNAHLILGFLNFIAAIPLMLWGIALAVKQRRAPSARRGAGIALVSLLTFYTHVVPFALMALGIGLVALSRDVKQTLRGGLPLVPATVAALVWVLKSPAGQATVTAAAGAERGPKPRFQTVDRALSELPRWMTDVLAGDQDRWLLWAWVTVMGASLLAGLLARVRRDTVAVPDALSRSLSLRLGLLAPICALLYFVTPVSYDWIWPIAPRFPLLCAVFTLLLLPPLPPLAGHLAIAAGLLIAAANFHYVGDAFAGFDDEEVGDFDRALSSIPKGKKVVGLIHQRRSRHVAFSPFIHFVAYYQARRGGAVMFTFADFPQSPFRFRDDDRPPRVPPRWEWMPQRVRPSQLDWYDYALVRGRPGQLARPGSGFAPVYRGKRWSVYRRESRSSARGGAAKSARGGAAEQPVEPPNVHRAQAAELHPGVRAVHPPHRAVHLGVPVQPGDAET